MPHGQDPRSGEILQVSDHSEALSFFLFTFWLAPCTTEMCSECPGQASSRNGLTAEAKSTYLQGYQSAARGTDSSMCQEFSIRCLLIDTMRQALFIGGASFVTEVFTDLQHSFLPVLTPHHY